METFKIVIQETSMCIDQNRVHFVWKSIGFLLALFCLQCGCDFNRPAKNDMSFDRVNLGSSLKSENKNLLLVAIEFCQNKGGPKDPDQLLRLSSEDLKRVAVLQLAWYQSFPESKRAELDKQFGVAFTESAPYFAP